MLYLICSRKRNRNHLLCNKVFNLLSQSSPEKDRANEIKIEILLLVVFVFEIFPTIWKRWTLVRLLINSCVSDFYWFTKSYTLFTVITVPSWFVLWAKIVNLLFLYSLHLWVCSSVTFYLSGPLKKNSISIPSIYSHIETVVYAICVKNSVAGLGLKSWNIKEKYIVFMRVISYFLIN